jgi:hypothetical protein
MVGVERRFFHHGGTEARSPKLTSAVPFGDFGSRFIEFAPNLSPGLSSVAPSGLGWVSANLFVV